MTERSFSEIWASVLDYDLRRAEAAVAAVEKLRAASADEDEKFVAWLRGDAHGNSVRAAERRHDRADHDAVDAVYAIKDEAVMEASTDVHSDQLLDALKAYRDGIAQKIETVTR